MHRFLVVIETAVSDPNGMWEEESVPGIAYRYFDSTFTIGYRPPSRILKNVQFRLEFENQISNHKVYGNGRSVQNTINAMAVYTF